MKNGPLFLLGLFVALTISWGGIVVAANYQLGSLTPYFDEADGQAYPQRSSGIAARGQLVYADLGCASCHTQQVRRPDLGADQGRGWGDRQSVARDFIFQARPQLGASRFGPDLANVGARKPPYDAEDLLKLLYTGGPRHPSYRFLFDTRPIVGERSGEALKLTGDFVPPAGQEVVPTERALSLAQYLLSLDNSYVYPEARPVPPAQAGAEAAPAAAGKQSTEGKK